MNRTTLDDRKFVAFAALSVVVIAAHGWRSQRAGERWWTSVSAAALVSSHENITDWTFDRVDGRLSQQGWFCNLHSGSGDREPRDIMHMSEFLTTKEVAELLRLKERRVYDLAANGAIPCSRATGKLLFRRSEVDAWLEQYSSGTTLTEPTERPKVVLGSHDPLLDWALRESRCGLATYFDGSFDGLIRYKHREGIACGLHVWDEEDRSWNRTVVETRLASEPVVLIEWAWRKRGLIVNPEVQSSIKKLSDIEGLRVVPRQPTSGSHTLFETLMARERIARNTLTFTVPVRTEADAALAVLEGKGEVAFGLAAMAAQYRLGFVEVVGERYDLVIDRRAYFEPEMQALFAFCRSDAFAERAREYVGYDVAGLGRVHFNGR